MSGENGSSGSNDNYGRYSIPIMILLFLLAFIIRLIPTMSSSLPFNIDGFPLVRISEIMISTSHIPDHAAYSGLLGYNMKLPIFSLLLSQFSLITGIEPLTLIPYFCAFIGSISVIIIYAFVLKIIKNQMAAFMAGFFLAFTGLFVYVTTAAMKELLGIVLLCLLFYTYSLRDDNKFRYISVALLLLLPFVHHLSSLIAYITITTMTAYTIIVANKHEERYFKHVATEILLGPALGLIVIYYYKVTNMEFFSEVNNLNDSALMFSVCIIALLIHILISSPVTSKPWFILPLKTKKGDLSIFALFDEKTLVVVIGILIMYISSRITLFTSAPKTTALLLDLMLPYFILALIGMAGFNILRYSSFKHKPMIIAMFFAPLSLMIFSSLRGLDIFNFTLVFRAYNFIDIPLAIVSGIGIAYLIKITYATASKPMNSILGIKLPVAKILPVALFIGFCLLCVASVPLAYERVEAFGIQETTYDHEFEAMGWVAYAGIQDIASDQRNGDIIHPYYDVNCDWQLPWLLEEDDIYGNDTILVSDEWTTIGAQISILERVVISNESFDHLIERSNQIYSGGPESNKVYVLIMRE